MLNYLSFCHLSFEKNVNLSKVCSNSVILIWIEKMIRYIKEGRLFILYCIALMKAWLYHKVLYQSSIKCMSPISTQCYVFSPMPHKSITVNSNWVSISNSLKLFKTIEREVPWSKTNITFGQQMSNPKLNVVKQNLKTKSSTKLSIAKLLVEKTMGSMGEEKWKIFFFIISFQNHTLFLHRKVNFFLLWKALHLVHFLGSHPWFYYA